MLLNTYSFEIRRLTSFFFIFIILLIPIGVYAEPVDGEESPNYEGGILDAIEKFFKFITDIITGILDILKILTLEFIPSLVAMLVSIFAFFGRLIAYIVTFATIPAVALQGEVMTGIQYVLQFKILGFTVLGLVSTLVTFAVGFVVAKKLIL